VCQDQDEENDSEIHRGIHARYAWLAERAGRAWVTGASGDALGASQCLCSSESLLLPAARRARDSGSVGYWKFPSHALRPAASMLREAEARESVEHAG